MTVQLELAPIKRLWIDLASVTVLEVMSGRDFSADDLHAALPEPEHDNWFGVLIARLASSKKIRRIGAKPSVRKEANGRWVGIYRVNTEETK